ncbi:ABC transporter permease [Staphylospora marina]|uniref:ABC transporter permease n=1 Tax=Staphylospora marina TaxID=2490858 RepID=UPI000F5BA8EA|nr:ABC-2 family transporter protein [Staphylospora marina]
MGLWFYLLKASLRARMQYKTDFLVSSLATAMIMAVDYLLLAVILLRFRDVRGWTIEEVGVLYAVSTISLSLFRLIASELHHFDKYMVEGEFDQLLIRPVSPLVLLLSRHPDLNRLGGIAQGVLILAFSLTRLPAETAWNVLLYLPIAVMSGLLIGMALSLVTATVGFWAKRIKEFQPFTIYAPFTAANFPLSVYPGWLKALFFSLIPIAFMNYWPMVCLLGKGGTWLAPVLSPVFAAAAFGLALKCWNVGIRHYHSTGS